ncbi:MAG: epoxide hydrolase family protein [Flavobacteriaceae bacterium]
MPNNAKPFTTNVPDTVLADLRKRLELTRWPVEPEAAPWRYGVPGDYMRRVHDHWLNSYDWRQSEAAINRFPGYKAEIEGLEVHFLMEEGSGPAPRPLILTHGWPGSIVEFLDVIEKLAHPERFGGDAADAFTVVVPSIPGYGFSQAPAAPIGPRDVARMWNTLMTEVLGFASYFAQGGDWGAIVSSWLAFDHPETVAAMHLNMLSFRRPPKGAPSDEEAAWLKEVKARSGPESGYRIEQGTKPQTLAQGLTDSPMGLAAWVIEKFHGWTIPGETRDPPFSLDHLLANVMLYWLPGPAASSWLYISIVEGNGMRLPEGGMVTVPTGFLLCPKDLSLPPPREVVERCYNVASYEIAADGGHFLAFEQGDLFVRKVREFFRAYR